jgi:hypothetical protein
MSFLGRIFGTAAGETAKGLMEGIGGLATSIRSAITGELSPDARAKLEELAIQADSLQTQGQMKINVMEVQHSSIFVAGWRPFIGWVCGIALGWNFVVHPMVTWYMSIWEPLLKQPPPMDLSQLYPIVLGMLGLGMFRTYEKTRDAQKNH